MPDESPSQFERLSERVTQLEVLLTHLQQTVQDLNQVALEQSRSIDRLTVAVTGMKAHYASMSASAPEQRDPDLERPPHY